MSGAGGFGDDPGCYTELLFGDEIAGLDTDECFGFASSFSSGDSCNNSLNTPKMLCFGDYAAANLDTQNVVKTPEPASAGSLPKSNKKRAEKPGSNGGAPTGNQRNGKKQKGNGNCTAPAGNVKVVKKEKLGERITALQQLVSPFGKTDTASVLHEALGYIRFLQDQVQVLCSPYLQRGHPAPELIKYEAYVNGMNHKGEGSMKEGRKDDLRSRGLCLVPAELTVHVAESNGADMWTSAAMLDSVYSN